MSEVFQIVKNSWDTTNAAGQYMGLFVVAFIFLFVVESKKNKVLFSYCLLALVLVFNPFTANNLMTFWPGLSEYWYTFLLLPVVPICAYVCVETIALQKNQSDKWVVFGALVLIAAVGGILMNSTANLSKVENRAGISDECLQMIQVMGESGEPVMLCADDNTLESVRAYTSAINTPYEVSMIAQPEEIASAFYGGAMIELHRNMQSSEKQLTTIVELSRNVGCNYLSIPVTIDDREAMVASGYEAKLETVNYVLYRDNGLVESVSDNSIED